MANVKTGITLFSLTEPYVKGELDLEGVIRTAAELGAEGYEIVAADEWYQKKMLWDKNARREYFDVERNRRQKGDIYITQIIDEERTSDDPRLR